MTNTDSQLQSYYQRALRLETEKREAAEDLKELRKEMKGSGVSSDEVAAVFLAVRRSFETADKRAARITREEIANALGDFADMPLGRAAVEAA